MRHTVAITALFLVACGGSAFSGPENVPPLNKPIAQPMGEAGFAGDDAGDPPVPDATPVPEASAVVPDAGLTDSPKLTKQDVEAGSTVDAGTDAPSDPDAGSDPDVVTADVVVAADAAPEAAAGPNTYSYTFDIPGMDIAFGDTVPGKFVVNGTCGGEVRIDYYQRYSSATPTATGLAASGSDVNICLGLGSACSSYFDVKCTNGVVSVTGSSVPNTGGFCPTDTTGMPIPCEICSDR